MARMKPGYMKGDALAQFKAAEAKHGRDAVKAISERRKRKAGPDGQRMIQFGAASAAAGGEVSNRPPANRQGLKDEVPLTPSAGGEDRIEASLRVVWRDWDRLGTSLAALKQQAKQAADEGGDEVAAIELPGSSWMMRASGWRSPTEKGPAYAYVLQDGGIMLGIANRAAPSANFFNVRVVVGSVPLMACDARALWAQVLREIDDLGGDVEKVILSRVDPCADLIGEEHAVSAYTEKFRADHWISRAADTEDHTTATIYQTRRKDTGFRIGKGIMLRVYDKLEETKTDDVKFQTVMRCRWGKLPTHATRVEFQIRREQLKSLGIDSVEDWFAKRADVCAYLCREWFRFTRKAPDRKNGNQKRAKTWEIWDEVVAAFAKWTGAEQKPIQRVKSIRVDFKQLRRQVAGCATTLVAKALGFTRNVQDVVKFVVAEVVRTIEEMPEKTLWKRLDKKLANVHASQPGDLVEPFQREYTPQFVEWFQRWGKSDRKYDGPHFLDQVPNVSEWLGLKPGGA